METDRAAAMLLWTQIGAVGQAIGALATAAAVIVSLWIVLSERSVRLRVQAGLRMIISEDGSPALDIIGIQITNLGQRIAHVKSISWRTGWLSRIGPAWLRQQWAMLRPEPQQQASHPPFEIAPGEERTVYVGVSAYAHAKAVKLRLEFFNRKFPWRRDPAPAKVVVLVHAAGSKDAVGRVEKGLAKFLATGQIDRGAAAFNEKVGLHHEAPV